MRTRRSWRNQERLWKALGKEKQPELNCKWTEDDDGPWTPVGPSDNVERCLYCGKALKEIKFVGGASNESACT
jgi:hypothetical protein